MEVGRGAPLRRSGLAGSRSGGLGRGRGRHPVVAGPSQSRQCGRLRPEVDRLGGDRRGLEPGRRSGGGGTRRPALAARAPGRHGRRLRLLAGPPQRHGLRHLPPALDLGRRDHPRLARRRSSCVRPRRQPERTGARSRRLGRGCHRLAGLAERHRLRPLRSEDHGSWGDRAGLARRRRGALRRRRRPAEPGPSGRRTGRRLRGLEGPPQRPGLRPLRPADPWRRDHGPGLARGGSRDLDRGR